MSALRRLLVGLALAMACQAAWSDRSRLADESDIFDAGDCEIEAASERKTGRGAARERLSSLQLGCGVGWRSEVAVALSSLRSDEPRLHAAALEAKTSLIDRAAGRIGWVLAWGVEGGSSSSGGSGSGWRRTGQFVALEATYATRRDWLIEGRLGTARDRGSRSDATIWSLGLEQTLGEAFEARLELAGDDRQRPMSTAALRWEFWPDRALLSLSYGTRSGPARERQLGLALTVEF